MSAKWLGRAGSRFLVVFLLLAWTGRYSVAQVPADPNRLLQQLNEAQIDPSQVYVLRDTQIARDRVKLYFNRGFVAFLTPVAGEVTGAVFVGDGEVLLIPPNAVEKQNLAQFTQAAVLSEPFSFAYLRFTDQTARELLAHARPPDPDDTDQPTGRFEPLGEKEVERLRRLLAPSREGLEHKLVGHIDGPTHSPKTFWV